MAFRGRGRGRGRGGFGSGFDRPAKHAPHEDFPDITLPAMTCAKATNEEKAWIQSTLKFVEFWRHSCYHLEEDAPKKKNEDKETERFSDRKRKTQAKREALASYLKLTPANFPAELVQGSRRGQLSSKRLRWDRDSDEQAFEVFEKLEEKHKARASSVYFSFQIIFYSSIQNPFGDHLHVVVIGALFHVIKLDGDKEGDDEGEHEEEEVEEDENTDDDYNQNVEFDDDDDDWNQEEEAHEDYYD